MWYEEPRWAYPNWHISSELMWELFNRAGWVQGQALADAQCTADAPNRRVVPQVLQTAILVLPPALLLAALLVLA